MHRIIQINIGGRLIPMEDEAYMELKTYLASLDRQFAQEAGKAEILEDIEARIAELFHLRLQNNAQTISMADVRKVTEKLGAAYALSEESYQYTTRATFPVLQQKKSGNKRLFRHPTDKMIAGVSGGLASYFGIDPILIRIGFVLTTFFALGGLITYIICWIVMPKGNTQDVVNSKQHQPDYDAIKQNVLRDINDLKNRAEKMSVELQEWFKRKKW